MNLAVILWAAVIIAMAAVEAATVNLVSIWFAGGALAALIAALLGASVIVQGVIFLGVSGGLLACLYPLAKRITAKKHTAESPNFDRVIGMTAPVTETIDNIAGVGAVKVDGKVWSARSTAEEVIDAGTLVTVDRIDGVKLYVTKKQ